MSALENRRYLTYGKTGRKTAIQTDPTYFLPELRSRSMFVPKPASRRRSSRVIVDLLNRGVSVAGIAAREELSRPELAPQQFEKIESGPGNGMASDASKLQHLVHGRAADRALRLEHRLKSGRYGPAGQSGSATCFREARIVVAFFFRKRQIVIQL
jgi:hypothetical protein